MFTLRKQRMQQESEAFLSCIDRALEVFGSSVKSVVYFRFQEEHGLKREDIGSKPELFVQTIDKFFGVGSHLVKSSIEKEIRSALASYDLGHSDTASILRKGYEHFQRAK